MDKYVIPGLYILSLITIISLTVFLILNKPCFHTYSSRPAHTATVPAGKCAHASTSQATKGHS
jgi:hypothetical protein